MSCQSIAALACQFGSRLTVGGFAVGKGQFSTLEEMVKTAEEYNCKTFLMKASLRVEDLSTAFCEMSTLITNTKTTMTDFKTNLQRTFRNLIREPKSAVEVYIEEEKEWKMYTNVVRVFFSKEEYCWVRPERSFESPSAVGIAVRDYIFGEGRERAVRRVREINIGGQFVGKPLVGKETLFQEDLDPDDVRAFHKNFCKLQQLAKKYAKFFNRKLMSLPGIDHSKVPTIDFLDCWVMLFTKENNEKGAILVEKMLDHKKYMKWNTNHGYVLRTESTYPGSATSFSGKDGDWHFSLEDIPQAYSHFTYNASGRRFLVCDLQGVLNTNKQPPVFELTDPAIHYKKRTDRDDYGRTDLDENGIEQFFHTHVCSDLCRMVCRQFIDTAEDDIIEYESIREGPSKRTTSPSMKVANEENTTKRVKFAL
jgi:hypothetical protein